MSRGDAKLCRARAPNGGFALRRRPTAPGSAPARARGLAPLLREHAARGERERRLSPAVVAAWASTTSSASACRASTAEVRRPSASSSSRGGARGSRRLAGVVRGGHGRSGLLAAYLEPDAAQEVYGVAGRAVGGVFAPKGRAEVAADGFRVSGRWPFAAGWNTATG